MSLERVTRHLYRQETKYGQVAKPSPLFRFKNKDTGGQGGGAERREGTSQWDTVVRIFRDPATRQRLMDDSHPDHTRISTALETNLGRRTRVEATALAQEIISALGRSNGPGSRDFRNAHERIAALTLLDRYVPKDKLDPDRVQHSYSKALREEGVADDQARAWSVYQAGKIVAPVVPGTAQVWHDTREGLEQIASDMGERPKWFDTDQVTRRIPLSSSNRAEVVRDLRREPNTDPEKISGMVARPDRSSTSSTPPPPEELIRSSDAFPGKHQYVRDRREIVAQRSREGKKPAEIAKELHVPTHEIYEDRRILKIAGVSLEPEAKDKPKKGRDERRDDDPGKDEPGEPGVGPSRTPGGPSGGTGPAAGGRALEPGREEPVAFGQRREPDPAEPSEPDAAPERDFLDRSNEHGDSQHPARRDVQREQRRPAQDKQQPPGKPAQAEPAKSTTESAAKPELTARPDPRSNRSRLAVAPTKDSDPDKESKTDIQRDRVTRQPDKSK